MAGEKSIPQAIVVQDGHNFEIPLYSQPGSTGFSWYLAALPLGIVLLGESSAPVPPVHPGSKTRQTFTFAATKLGTFVLEFELLRPWEPTQPADRRTFEVRVPVYDEKKERGGLTEVLKELAGQGKFAAYNPGNIHFPINMLYGFPPPDGTGQVTLAQTATQYPILPYGTPQGLTAPGPVAHTVVDSAENCVVKYGFPFGVSTDPQHCVLKYGFVPHPVYAVPPHAVPLYGIIVKKSGTDAVKEAEPAKGETCVVKYGTPQGVAVGNTECNLKYGFPVPPPTA